VTLTITATNDEGCAVGSLSNLLRRYPAPVADLLFNPGFAYTRGHATGLLKRLLLSLNMPGNYSGHSFRRGAATSARLAGLSDSEIQLLGRWKSDSYRLYIDTPPHLHPERLQETSEVSIKLESEYGSFLTLLSASKA